MGCFVAVAVAVADKDHDHDHDHDHDCVTARLLIDAGIGPGLRVLDVGCGRGDVALRSIPSTACSMPRSDVVC